MQPSITATKRKFGHPSTLVADYRWWVVLMRPRQVTLGSLVLAAKCDVSAFSDLPPDAFTELGVVIPAIEGALKRGLDYEKINYLMLMMVDPHPHFHVFPRYAGERTLAGISIGDAAFPGPPDLGSGVDLDEAARAALGAALRAAFAGSGH